MKRRFAVTRVFFLAIILLAIGASAAGAAPTPYDYFYDPISGLSDQLPSLAKLYSKNFTLGACVEPSQLTGDEAKLLLKHFSGITAENAMKPESMAPALGKYYFDDADKIVAFAQKNKLAVRGHTLLWHAQNAKWMFYDDANNFVTKEVLLKRLKDYIYAVVGRYKGKVYAWDVVNEVVEVNGMRNSEWYKIAGEEYIEKAFIYAHEADPKALLFINDYDTAEKLKRETLYKLIKRLVEKKIPVSGIGLQYHITMNYPSLDEIKTELSRFSEFGLPIHITELDMSLNQDANFEDSDPPEDWLIRQAHRYKEIFTIFKTYPLIKNVTFWGIHDGHTWLTFSPVVKKDWPLLFDKDYNAKPAFFGLADPSRLPEDVVVVNTNKNNFVAYAKKGTAVIDAVEDAAWKGCEEIKVNMMLQGNGSTGVAKAMWDENNLYVLVRVKDSTISKKSPNGFEQDSVEIFIDEKNDKLPTYADDDAQYRLNFANEFTFRGNPAKYLSATALTPDGYILEIAIPWRFIKPEVGVAIGFDLQVNDDNGIGYRSGYAKWNDPTNESFRNTSGFGKLMLTD